MSWETECYRFISRYVTFLNSKKRQVGNDIGLIRRQRVYYLYQTVYTLIVWLVDCVHFDCLVSRLCTLWLSG